MASEYEKCLQRQIARRDMALKALRNSTVDAGEGIKSEVERIQQGFTLEKILSSHPWATVGLALGAGVVASSALSSASSAHAQSSPQHVVVELRQPDGSTASVHPVEPPRPNPMAWVMQGIAAFEAVQELMRQLQTPKNPNENVPSDELYAP